MPSKPGKEVGTSFEIAMLLDEAADAIRTRSNHAYAAGRMALDDYMDARARELELRPEVSLIVATRLGDALTQAADAGEDIEQAIRDAKGPHRARALGPEEPEDRGVAGEPGRCAGVEGCEADRGGGEGRGGAGVIAAR